MNFLRMTVCAFVVAVACGSAAGEDLDVFALQAKIAAQEARLNDLQAKMLRGVDQGEGVVADGLTSLRKNATVTIGGTVNTRYYYRKGTVKSRFDDEAIDMGAVRKTNDARYGELAMSDVKLEGQIEVNDYFDAYFKFDLQSDDGPSHMAEQAWVRWKNICNSGFGILVGRDSLKYGMGPPVGELDSWSATDDTNGHDGMFNDRSDEFDAFMVGNGRSIIPIHTGWDHSRVTQITPYWENGDGTFKAEISFFQDMDYDDGDWSSSTMVRQGKYRRVRNDGLGSISGRITWQPFEGLTLVASAINQYNRYAKSALPALGEDDWVYGVWGRDRGAKNNTAASLGFEYIPCFLNNKATLWGYYQHGWNEGWLDDVDSDLVNAGVKFDFTDQFYGFVQGDYLYVKDGKAMTFHKAKGWAGYVGLGYSFPYGVDVEVGYRHERIDYKDRTGDKHTKYRGDVVYAHLGFNF